MRSRIRTLFKILTFPLRMIAGLIRWVFGWAGALGRELGGLFAEDPPESTMIDALTKAVQDPAGVLEHINALRKHLLRATIVLLLTTSLSLFYARQIMEFLAGPIGGIQNLRAIGVTEPIGVFMRVSFLSGFAIALPYIILELLLFAAPGLKRRERKVGLIAVPAISVLFLFGMGFTYFFMLGPALEVLIGFMDIPTTPQPSSYFPFVTSLMFWIGLSFEFPLLIYVVVSIGLIRANVLIAQARTAVVLLAVLAAAITPTIDPINMLLVWGPLVALYFLGIGLALIAQRGRDRRLKAGAG